MPSISLSPQMFGYDTWEAAGYDVLWIHLPHASVSIVLHDTDHISTIVTPESLTHKVTHDPQYPSTLKVEPRDQVELAIARMEPSYTIAAPRQDAEPDHLIVYGDGQDFDDFYPPDEDYLVP